MVCPGCGTENRPGRRFCLRCGEPLAATCPDCGASNEPEASFCGECGVRLDTGAAASPGRPATRDLAVVPVVERRLVSVLFTDLVGFTPFAEEHDAEETRELLGRYFDLAEQLISRYGGTVEKFIGDAVMAVWGAPIAHEDDAERAVRAGLELIDAIPSLGASIQARAGVLTGEAVVTVGATNRGMVAGDLVNTASRLQSAAAPGTVLVGEASQRAASAAIVFEPAGEQALKGKSAPVPAWRALRVVAERGGRNRTAALEAPFVGRAEELRLLKDLFHATVRERRPRHVSVIGPAGIGKTRLAWEFLKYADGLVEPIRWHEGRSPAYGDGITFWALGEMVRARASLLETDDAATTHAKIAETVAAHVPDPDERRWIEPALLALLGVEGSAVDTEQLFGAWRTFFERIADATPVVMVFEDLQHADPGLLDFIDHLLEWAKGVPIYVLTLARRELLDRRPGWGVGRRDFASLHLEPLPEAAMRDLLRGLVPGLPEAAAATIVERADGIPLYAIETIRMLLADGRLVASDGAYRPAGNLAGIAVPETLTELIAARLDALEPADRAMVLDAAVLGQSFSTAALAAVSGIPAADLEPRLQALVRREFLTVEVNPRSPERGQHAFVQALVREVGYSTLARRDRKVRHLAAARYFESLGSDEIAGALAGHYLAAWRSAPPGPEADEIAVQTRIALRAAAERAIALGSYDQALALLEHALAVAADRGETADLLERAGDAALAAARYEAAEAHLRQAVSAQRELGDRAANVRAMATLGMALLQARRTSEGLALLESAAGEFADLAADPAGIALGGQLARAYFLTGDFRHAIEAADRVLDVAEHADLPAIVADTLITKGSALFDLGRPIEGLGVLGAGQEVAEAHDLGRILCRALNNRSAHQCYRDPRAALEVARAGLVLARRLGLRVALADLLDQAASSAVRTGDWSWALSELEAAVTDDFEAVAQSTLLSGEARLRALRGDPVADQLDKIVRLVGEADDPSVLRLAPGNDGFAAFAAGRLGDARTAFLRAAALWAPGLGEWRFRAARAALWAGDATAARDDLALLEASGIHGPAAEADRRTVQAGIAALEGRSADALAVYRDALRDWRDLGLAWDEALCGLDMALLLDPADPEVRGAAEGAREILVRLEARPFLERLDAAMGVAPAARP